MASKISDDELTRMVELAREGRSAHAIASELGRSAKSIRAHLRSLGMAEDRKAATVAVTATEGRKVDTLGNPTPSLTMIRERSPRSSIIERRRNAGKIPVAVLLEPEIHRVCTNAAEHVRVTVEKFLGDVIDTSVREGSLHRKRQRAVAHRLRSPSPLTHWKND